MYKARKKQVVGRDYMYPIIEVRCGSQMVSKAIACRMCSVLHWIWSDKLFCLNWRLGTLYCTNMVEPVNIKCSPSRYTLAYTSERATLWWPTSALPSPCNTLGRSSPYWGKLWYGWGRWSWRRKRVWGRVRIWITVGFWLGWYDACLCALGFLHIGQGLLVC